jgi:hypothetical protein
MLFWKVTGGAWQEMFRSPPGESPIADVSLGWAPLPKSGASLEECGGRSHGRRAQVREDQDEEIVHTVLEQRPALFRQPLR